MEEMNIFLFFALERPATASYLRYDARLEELCDNVIETLLNVDGNSKITSTRKMI